MIQERKKKAWITLSSEKCQKNGQRNVFGQPWIVGVRGRGPRVGKMMAMSRVRCTTIFCIV
jgi:hypothetical protein